LFGLNNSLGWQEEPSRPVGPICTPFPPIKIRFVLLSADFGVIFLFKVLVIATGCLIG
jgi:hypothetical protein